MQFIIYILGLCTGLLVSIIAILTSKRYTNNITTFLEKPIGKTEIVGDSDEEAIVKENLSEEQIIL